MTNFPTLAGYDDALAQEPPAEEGNFVPFSAQNRMKTFLVLAMLMDSIIIIGGVVWLQKYNSTAGSTPLAYAIIGFGGIGFKELLVMLHTHQEARQTRHDLRGAVGKATEIVQRTSAEILQKTNGGLTRAVQEVGEQVRTATHDQMIDDPRCHAAIEEAIERAAAKAADAAEARVRKVVAELKGGQA